MENIIEAVTGQEEKFVTQVTNGKHQLTVDEPKQVGGTDKGMNPVELLKGALASCTTITLKMYLEAKQIEVSEIKVAIDTTQLEDGEKAFVRTISISPPLEPSFQKRVLNVANKCPVHKLLENKVEVQTNLN